MKILHAYKQANWNHEQNYVWHINLTHENYQNMALSNINIPLASWLPLTLD
jgi:hypothetical protein